MRAGINTSREPPQSVLAVSRHLWLCSVSSSSASSSATLGKPAAIEMCFAKGVKTPTLVSWLNLLYQSILLLPSRCSAVSSGGNPPTSGQVRASIHWGMAEHTFPCIPQPLTLHQTTDDTVNIQLPKHWMGKPESLLDSTCQGLKPQPLWCTAGGKEEC